MYRNTTPATLAQKLTLTRLVIG